MTINDSNKYYYLNKVHLLKGYELTMNGGGGTSPSIRFINCGDAEDDHEQVLLVIGLPPDDDTNIPLLKRH